ncbi:hypothetical protein GGI42DRAFT_177193 [Trichoderma sp. SZMC 28013]
MMQREVLRTASSARSLEEDRQCTCLQGKLVRHVAGNEAITSRILTCVESTVPGYIAQLLRALDVLYLYVYLCCTCTCTLVRIQWYMQSASQPSASRLARQDRQRRRFVCELALQGKMPADVAGGVSCIAIACTWTLHRHANVNVDHAKFVAGGRLFWGSGHGSVTGRRKEMQGRIGCFFCGRHQPIQAANWFRALSCLFLLALLTR